MRRIAKIQYLIVIISNRVQKAASYTFEKAEVGVAGGHVLGELFRRGGICSFEELMTGSFFSEPSVSRAVKELIEKEYVSRIAVQEDLRRKEICITPKGSQLFNELISLYLEGQCDALAGISEEEQERLEAYLRRYYGGLPGANVSLTINPGCWPRLIHFIEVTADTLEQQVIKYFGNEYEIPETQVLHRLCSEGGQISFKQIEKDTLISQPAVVRYMGKLEKRGWVTTGRSEQDKRAKYAIATENGKEALREFNRLLEKWSRASLEGLEDRQIREFEKLLEQINNNMQKEG